MEGQLSILHLMAKEEQVSVDAPRATSPAGRAFADEASRGLIAACQHGDRQAFQQLFELYKDRVYSVAMHYFNGDEGSAKDVTQQVFLKLFAKISQFHYDAGFGTWLYRVVANACLDEQRRRRKFVSVDEATGASQLRVRASQHRELEQSEIADTVRTAISELRPKLRLPILLKYVEGLSYEEIAASLGCSQGTVASRLNRGHKALAQKLSHLRKTLMSKV
ncbi:MAG: sigma-70 family RNA polymerase sigma factor [Pyrinomonadaceae bacterium]